MNEAVILEIGFWVKFFLTNMAFAVILILIVRKILRFEKYITIDHIELVNKIMLGVGVVAWLRWLVQIFMTWYHGYIYEIFAFYNRGLGSYWWVYFLILFISVVAPLFLAFKKVRRSLLWTFVISLMINAVIIMERLTIIMISMNRDYLPSTWKMYY